MPLVYLSAFVKLRASDIISLSNTLTSSITKPLQLTVRQGIKISKNYTKVAIKRNPQPCVTARRIFNRSMRNAACIKKKSKAKTFLTYKGEQVLGNFK